MSQKERRKVQGGPGLRGEKVGEQAGQGALTPAPDLPARGSQPRGLYDTFSHSHPVLSSRASRT